MTLLRRAFGVLAWALFIAGELHAFWVLHPLSNLDHAWMVFADDSIVPFQFRLASYRAGAGDFGKGTTLGLCPQQLGEVLFDFPSRSSSINVAPSQSSFTLECQTVWIATRDQDGAFLNVHY